MAGQRRWATPATVTMAAGGALASALLSLSAAHTAPLPTADGLAPAVLVLLVATAFCLAELTMLHLEFRRQAFSLTLGGIPLVVGLLVAGPRELVAARVLGVLVAFCIQRLQPLKAAFNLASYALDAALVTWLLHAVLPIVTPLRLISLPVLLVGVIGSELLMSLQVVAVIWLHSGQLSRSAVTGVLTTWIPVSAASVAVGVTTVLLLDRGPLGWLLLAGLGTVIVAVHRSLRALHRQHEALARVHDFIEDGSAAESLEELAGRLLARIRAQLNVGRVGLYLDGEDLPWFTVDEDDVLTVEAYRADVWSDWLVLRVRETQEPAVLPRNTRDRALAAWLAAHGRLDAALVPIGHGEVRGVLFATDRLGETSTFTAEDGVLLATLGGHLAVAVDSCRLLARQRFDATHDQLTGLANRAALDAVLPGLAGGPGVALLCGDLVRFADINDALGHPVGDDLLRLVADRLRGCMPAGSTVARLSADEFAVAVPGVPDAAAGLALADRVQAALAEPIVLSGARISTRIRLGVAVADPGAATGDLLRRADIAMYQAKADDRPVVLYAPELDAGRGERLALLADLELALERDELEVWYQPKYDLAADRIASVEALVRWRHPRLGLLAPVAFVPLAESTGLMESLTAIVLDKALAQCRRWLDAGISLTVAVNLSAHSVGEPDLPERVAAALAAAGVPAEHLVLELTESAAMEISETTLHRLDRLAELGLALSLDDFGTGYSSLAYLQKLPVKELKIDRSFVTDLGARERDERGAALVSTILALAYSLGLRVVAEGVEDRESLHWLRDAGCDLVQGYHISRPLPAEELTGKLPVGPAVPRPRSRSEDTRRPAVAP